jgi:hypothetical protein
MKKKKKILDGTWWSPNLTKDARTLSIQPKPTKSTPLSCGTFFFG